MKDYEGQWALVTGASAGIGASFARKLAQKGANIILVARREDKLKALAQEITQRYNVQVHVVAMDLGAPNASQQLFAKVQSLGLRVQLLVNNAGMGVIGRLNDTDFERNRQMIHLNVNALSELTQLFLPAMLEAKKGAIFNLASTASFQPLPYMAQYAASKAFVLSFTEALSAEYRKSGVRFLAVCPGATESEFFSVAGINTPDLALDTPETVVTQSLRAMKGGKISVICGHWSNYLLAQLNRFFPRFITVYMSEIIMRSAILKPQKS